MVNKCFFPKREERRGKRAKRDERRERREEGGMVKKGFGP